MGHEQKDDVFKVFSGWKNAGNLDYVSCWYKVAGDFIKSTSIRAAFVSTNSITQGEQAALLWQPLFATGIHIDFAYRTFKWDSESDEKAAVHCVIVGFSAAPNDKQKMLFYGNQCATADNINGYLVDADNIFITRLLKPLSDVPEIFLGGQAIDDGNLVITCEERDDLLKKDSALAKFMRPYMMGKDFLERRPRYCFWLVGADISEIRSHRVLTERIAKVKAFRAASKRKNTLKAADFPMLFADAKEAKTPYIAIPKVSSENRKYIPMDYLSAEIIPGDKLFVMENATLYHFGVLNSNVHMAWTRAVCGRLEMRYSYSNTIVYNNFPWPFSTPRNALTDISTPLKGGQEAELKAAIEKTAQGILDARAIYPNSSLADLYDETTMPLELRRAHQANDRAVMQAYGFDTKTMNEEKCVAELMKMYQKLIKN